VNGFAVFSFQECLTDRGNSRGIDGDNDQMKGSPDSFND
jgi:hypothetical protein